MWGDRYKDIRSENNYQLMLFISSWSLANTVGNGHKPLASGIRFSALRLLARSLQHLPGVRILAEAGGVSWMCRAVEGDGGVAGGDSCFQASCPPGP